MSRKILANVFYSYLFVTRKILPDKVTIIFIICKLRSIWCWELWFRVIEIAQNSSTFPVWSTKNTTFRFSVKMFDRSKDRYLFVWTLLLIANNWCLQHALYQTPGSTALSLIFNSLALQETSIDTWAVLSVSMVETTSRVTVSLYRHD